MSKEKSKRRETKVNQKNVNDFIINGDKLVYIPTGEVIDNCFIIHDYMNVMQELSKEETIPRDFFCNNWNSKKKFTKIYQVDVRDYCNGLSASALGLFFILISNVKKSTNEVIIDGVRPNNKQLAEMLNVSDRTIDRLFVELEKSRIVKRVGNTKSRMILVNPNLCFNGKNAIKSTVALFD